MAVALGEEFQLLLRFDSFGDDFLAQFPAHHQDGADQLGILLVLADVLHELAVDLDDVDGEGAQVGEGGLAGAEIVERNAETGPVQLLQCGRGLTHVAEQGVFGDFEYHLLRKVTDFHQQPGDAFAIALMTEDGRSQVDRQAQSNSEFLIQLLLEGQAVADHPACQIVHQHAVFKHAQKGARVEQAAFWVFPAQQRLAGEMSRVAQVDDRLVMQAELVPGDGLAQLVFEIDQRLLGIFQCGIEQRVLVSSLSLGLIHGDIGIAQQGLGIATVQGRKGHANRGGGMNFLAVDIVGSLEQADDLACQYLGLRRVLQVLDDDGELVAAEPGDGVFLAQAVAQALGRLLQQLVAEKVPQRIVDQLEAVEIQQHDGGTAVAAGFQFQCVIEALVEHQAVRQLGQHIVVGDVVETLFAVVNALTHLVEGRDQLPDFAGGSRDFQRLRHAAGLQVEGLAQLFDRSEHVAAGEQVAEDGEQQATQGQDHDRAGKLLVDAIEVLDVAYRLSLQFALEQ